jgi:hypothetical protein
VLDGQFALARAFVGKFVKVRRGVRHAHRQRAEIVQAGNLDLARVHRVEDARHEADADAVAQLGVFKAEVADFAQHGASVRVAVGIPAGGNEYIVNR